MPKTNDQILEENKRIQKLALIPKRNFTTLKVSPDVTANMNSNKAINKVINYAPGQFNNQGLMQKQIEAKEDSSFNASYNQFNALPNLVQRDATANARMGNVNPVNISNVLLDTNKKNTIFADSVNRTNRNFISTSGFLQGGKLNQNVNNYSMKAKYYQEGGAMPAQEMAPAPGQEGGEAGNEMMAMLQQVVESQDPAMALQFCNQLAQSIGGGGQEAAPQADSAMAAPVPQGKNGMKIPEKEKGKGKKMSAVEKFQAMKKEKAKAK